MSNLSDFTKLKREVEQHRSEADRAEGAYRQLLAKLKEEYHCSSLEKGEQLWQKLEKELAAKMKDLDLAKHEYEKQFYNEDD